MMQLGFSPFENIEYERRHAELVKAAEQDRMVGEALRQERQGIPRSARLLGWVGQRLVNAGSKLEEIASVNSGKYQELCQDQPS